MSRVGSRDCARACAREKKEATRHKPSRLGPTKAWPLVLIQQNPTLLRQTPEIRARSPAAKHLRSSRWDDRLARKAAQQRCPARPKTLSLAASRIVPRCPRRAVSRKYSRPTSL